MSTSALQLIITARLGVGVVKKSGVGVENWSGNESTESDDPSRR